MDQCPLSSKSSTRKEAGNEQQLSVISDLLREISARGVEIGNISRYFKLLELCEFLELNKVLDI